MRTLLLAALACSMVSLQPQTRQYLVTVMDDDRKPVAGLGAEDFSLKDGGARQPVVAAEPAGDPMAVAIVAIGVRPDEVTPAAAAVDATIAGIRGAIRSNRVTLSLETDVYRSVIAGLEEVGYLSAIYRRDAIGVEAGLDAPFTLAGSDYGGYRRVIVVIVGTAVHAPADAGPDLASALQRDRVSLWTIATGGTSAAGPAAQADSRLDAATRASGGLFWRVASAQELPAAARELTALVTTAQYVVTVNWPTLAVGPAPIATRHDRGIVLVPLWSR